jgi:hypothetical protein
MARWPVTPILVTPPCAARPVSAAMTTSLPAVRAASPSIGRAGRGQGLSFGSARREAEEFAAPSGGERHRVAGQRRLDPGLRMVTAHQFCGRLQRGGVGGRDVDHGVPAQVGGERGRDRARGGTRR